MKISFMGASVTAQAYSHKFGELTGYVAAFQQIAQVIFGKSYEQKVFAYPGNRFGDAGLLKVHEVISYRPKICILEPLVEDTTRGIPPSEAAVQYVYTCLLKNNILPVTLFLPTLSSRIPSSLLTYSLFEKIASSLGLSETLIEISIPHSSADAMLRDNCHTNTIGAFYYASLLAPSIKQLLDSKKDLQGIILSQAKIKAFELKDPFLISPIPLPCLPFCYHSIRLKCCRFHEIENQTITPMDAVSLVQEQIVGPHSPVIVAKLVTPFEEVVQVKSVWDPYCHYRRESYTLLLEQAKVQSSVFYIDIAISKEMPD